MTRIELLAKLEDEIAQGYPDPWWPQDRLDATALQLSMGQMRALSRLIGLLADEAAEVWGTRWDRPTPLRAVS